MSKYDRLIEVLLDGDTSLTIREVSSLLEKGVCTADIVSKGLEAAMQRLDRKCTAEQFNLLEIMLTGRAATEAMKILYPDDLPVDSTKGTVVLATLEGDIHDLGKNILDMMLRANGYRTVDCGRNCAVSKVVAAAAEHGTRAVCLSGLVTTIIPQVRQVRGALAAASLNHVKILAGGAALRQAAAEQLDVDFVADTAFDGVRFLDDQPGGAA